MNKKSPNIVTVNAKTSRAMMDECILSELVVGYVNGSYSAAIVDCIWNKCI